MGNITEDSLDEIYEGNFDIDLNIKGSKYKDDYIYFKVANVGWGKLFKSRISIKKR